MSKGFFKWQRNPFKIWQSYVGLVVASFFPLPSWGGFVPMILSFRNFANWNLLIWILTLSILASGFFFGASTKRGRDNFLPYAVGFGLLPFIIIALVIFGGF